MFKRFYQHPNFRLSALVGALMLTGTLIGAPALADTQRPSVQLPGMTNGQITDCVAFVRDQRSLAEENGVAMSRRDQKRYCQVVLSCSIL